MKKQKAPVTASSAIRKFTGLAAVIVYALFGLGLILFPALSTLLVVYGLAVILAVIGIVNIIKYFIDASKVEFDEDSFSLTIGLAALTLGGVIAAQPSFLITIIPFLWGALLVVGGYAKLQAALDVKREGIKNWWIYLIGAVISLSLGLVLVFVAEVSTLIIGISMLAEAAMDLAAVLLKKHYASAAKKRAASAAAAPAAAPAAPAPEPESPFTPPAQSGEDTNPKA